MSLWTDHNGEPCRVEKITEMTDAEILELAEKSGTFNFLNDKEEDVYTAYDGELYRIETKDHD